MGLGGRLRVSVSPGTETIEAYLSAVLDSDVLISAHLGAARANRKPVLQLLTPRGETTGFAKVSINPLTRSLILAERATLDKLAAKHFDGLSIPRVLHHGQWQGHEVLVMSALPVWRRRKALRAGQLSAAMAEVAAVGGRSRAPLAGSAYLTRLRSRLDAAPAGPDRAALSAALDTWPPSPPGQSWATVAGTVTGPAGTWRAQATDCWYGTGSGSHWAFQSASTPCITACNPPWSAAGSHPRPRRPNACRPQPHHWHPWVWLRPRRVWWPSFTWPSFPLVTWPIARQRRVRDSDGRAPG